MICTDDFVFVHFPKTGGTFVADVLQRVLSQTGRRYEEEEMHARATGIPSVHQGKPILACVRSPYDLKVSQYQYRWWKSRESKPILKELHKRCPGYRNWTFEEYVVGWDQFVPLALSNAARNPFTRTVGQYSQKFIDFFFRAPDAFFADLTEEMLLGDLEQAMFPVTFLTTETLNDGLCDFLLRHGFKEEEVAFIRDEKRILPPGAVRSRNDRWQQHYTPGLKAYVRQQERLMFKLFPEFEERTPSTGSSGVSDAPEPTDAMHGNPSTVAS